MAVETLFCAEMCPWGMRCFELRPGCSENIKKDTDPNAYVGVRLGETRVTVVNDGFVKGSVENGQYTPKTS